MRLRDMQFTISSAIKICEEALTKRELNVAKDVITKIYEAEPNKPEVINLFAKILIYENNIDETLRLLHKALPNKNADVAFTLILYLSQLGENERLTEILSDSKLTEIRKTFENKCKKKFNHIDILEPLSDFYQVPNVNDLRNLRDHITDKSEQILNTLKLNQAFQNNRSFIEAKIEYHSQRSEFDLVLLLLARLEKLNPSDISIKYGYSKCLRLVGNYRAAIEYAEQALEIDPKNYQIRYEHARALQDLKLVSEAIAAYKICLHLQPKNVELVSTLGKLHSEMSEFNLAKLQYETALKLDPSHARTCLNYGNLLLSEKGDADKAIQLYSRVKKDNPFYRNSLYSLAYAYRKIGKVTCAIKKYQEMVEIFNDGDAYILLLSMQLQTLDGSLNFKVDSSLLKTVERNPKLKILEIINELLKLNATKAKHLLPELAQIDLNAWRDRLDTKDLAFVRAYKTYLSSLLKNVPDDKSIFEKKIYHIGDSHCLSFAGGSLKIDGMYHTITPKIVFGAKAYHLGKDASTEYKEFATSIVKELPINSHLMFSFGEIDCRWNEGILHAAKMKELDITNLAKQTARKYVLWVKETCDARDHIPYILNLPAPISSTDFSQQLNRKRQEVTRIYNQFLHQSCSKLRIRIVDIYSHTLTNSGEGVRNFYCDDIHLDYSALALLQNQIMVPAQNLTQEEDGG